MSENKKVFFIINKYSGTGYFSDVERRIITACGDLDIECSIEFTKERGHATELAYAAVRQKFDGVFAVGGDGTVNEVAQALLRTGIPLGILPKGSGNGLARHLGIPMALRSALDLLASKKSIVMDTILINDRLSVNVSGVGFDGHIASLFGKDGKRGLLAYSNLALQEFLRYKEFEVALTIDGEKSETHAFIIALANSTQFGNNARVAPNASVCDGLIDVCIIKKVPILQVPAFAIKMFSGNFDQSEFVQIKQAKQVTLEFPSPVAFHIDGEAMPAANKFSVSIQPATLTMMVTDGTERRY